jgi:hypothetical protein
MPKTKRNRQSLEEFISLLMVPLLNTGSFTRNDETNISAFGKFQWRVEIHVCV